MLNLHFLISISILSVFCNESDLITPSTIEDFGYNDLYAELLNDSSPMLVDPRDGELLLYNRISDLPEEIFSDNITILGESRFNYTKQTWIIIHGWRGAASGDYMTDLRRSILDAFDANVISVNWSRSANQNYFDSRWAMFTISLKVTQFLNSLKNHNYDTSNVNIVGFSLGAQMAGIAAKGVLGKFKGRIIGLDPASLLFSMDDVKGRLDKSDAEYVEVIHTNAGFAGFLYPIGHVDFYINGGVAQRECLGQIWACSHLKSFDIFRKSLTREIIGYKCPRLLQALTSRCPTDMGTTTLGGKLPKQWVAGIYHVKTE